MRAVLERQRWVGALAAFLALPLLVTGAVAWPFLLPYLAVAIFMAVARRPLRGLPGWAENVIAPLILVAVVAAGGARFGVLRPVAHLALLLAAVRLPAAARPGAGPLSSVMLVLVGVAGVASSTHPIVVVYLLVLAALVVTAVGRWNSLNAAEAGAMAGPAGWPGFRLVAGAVVLAAVVAAPLFGLLPRLRSPFAAAPVGGRPVAGFRESVTLGNIGEILQSRRVALRVRFPETDTVDPQWLRLAGATLNHYRRGVWVVNIRGDGNEGEGTIEARDTEAPVRTADVTLEVPGERLFVPVGSARLREWPEGVRVRAAPLGELRISRNAPLPVRYMAEFVPGMVAQPPPVDGDLTLPEGLERLESLARDLAQNAPNQLALAGRFEQHLQESFGYTTSLAMDAPFGGDPVEWFLFEGRRGHCEFFASAMVLLLRSQGIPARIQVGYLGGEHDGGGGYLVRDANAHAWVVAFVNGEWRVFDPTPAAEQPGVTRAEGFRGLWTGWLRVEQFWDRWILTFSLADQVNLIRWILEEGPAAARRGRRWAVLAAVGLAVVVLVRSLAVRRRRRRRAAAELVSRELEEVLESARGLGVLPAAAVTPRQALDHLAAAIPDVAGELSWLVRVHEHRRYASGGAPPAGRVRSIARRIRSRLRSGGAKPGLQARLTRPG